VRSYAGSDSPAHRQSLIPRVHNLQQELMTPMARSTGPLPPEHLPDTLPAARTLEFSIENKGGINGAASGSSPVDYQAAYKFNFGSISASLH